MLTGIQEAVLFWLSDAICTREIFFDPSTLTGLHMPSSETSENSKLRPWPTILKPTSTGKHSLSPKISPAERWGAHWEQRSTPLTHEGLNTAVSWSELFFSTAKTPPEWGLSLPGMAQSQPAGLWRMICVAFLVKVKVQRKICDQACFDKELIAYQISSCSRTSSWAQWISSTVFDFLSLWLLHVCSLSNCSVLV